MSEVAGLPADVFFGSVMAPSPDWRKDTADTDDPVIADEPDDNTDILARLYGYGADWFRDSSRPRLDYATVDQQHQIGDTKSVGGQTYVLNEHHRWEAQEQDGKGASLPTLPKPTGESDAEDKSAAMRAATTGNYDARGGEAGVEHPEQAEEPEEDALEPEDPVKQDDATETTEDEKHAHAAKALETVDPVMHSVFGKFIGKADGKPTQAKKLTVDEAAPVVSWLKQNAGTAAGGGVAVDLGGGKLGFSSPAGAIVLTPSGKGYVAAFSLETDVVRKAMEGAKAESPPPGPQPRPQNTDQPTEQAAPEDVAEGPHQQSDAGESIPAPTPQPAVATPPKQMPTAPQTPPPGTPMHHMTRDEFAATVAPATRHKQHLIDAINAGKEIPARVLKDYPELQRRIRAAKPANTKGKKTPARSAKDKSSHAEKPAEKAPPPPPPERPKADGSREFAPQKVGRKWAIADSKGNRLQIGDFSNQREAQEFIGKHLAKGLKASKGGKSLAYAKIADKFAAAAKRYLQN